MQSVVTGRALSRSMPISSPHCSQIPYSPSFKRCNASWILKMSLRSRSRIRRIEFRLASMEARSVGSGKFPSSSMFSTVLPASKRSSLIRWFRRLRKYSRFFWSREHLISQRNGVHYREKLTNINRGIAPECAATSCSPITQGRRRDADAPKQKPRCSSATWIGLMSVGTAEFF